MSLKDESDYAAIVVSKLEEMQGKGGSLVGRCQGRNTGRRIGYGTQGRNKVGASMGGVVLCIGGEGKALNFGGQRAVGRKVKGEGGQSCIGSGQGMANNDGDPDRPPRPSL